LACLLILRYCIKVASLTVLMMVVELLNLSRGNHTLCSMRGQRPCLLRFAVSLLFVFGRELITGFFLQFFFLRDRQSNGIVVLVGRGRAGLGPLQYICRLLLMYFRELLIAEELLLVIDSPLEFLPLLAVHFLEDPLLGFGVQVW